MNIPFNLVLFGLSGAIFAFVGACLTGKNKRRECGTAVLALLLNSLAIVCLLFVLIPAIPAAAKGGLFGAAAGVIVGTFLSTSMLSWELIAEFPGHRVRGVTIDQADKRASLDE